MNEQNLKEIRQLKSVLRFASDEEWCTVDMYIGDHISNDRHKLKAAINLLVLRMRETVKQLYEGSFADDVPLDLAYIIPMVVDSRMMYLLCEYAPNNIGTEPTGTNDLQGYVTEVFHQAWSGDQS